MKLFRYLSLLIIPVYLISCGAKKTTDIKTENKSILNENDIFNKQKVNTFINEISKEAQQDAKKQFLTGVDLYRNRKQLDSAIQSFKTSICIYPFSKTYYELGNALMDKEDFKSAISSYKMAEHLEYDPISLVLYNISCANSRSGNLDESLNYLQLAIENGYTNLDHIMGDKDLDSVRKDTRFNETVKTAMAGNSSSGEVLFGMYRSHFSNLSLPYVLDEKTSQAINFDNSISYDFDDFVPGMVDASFSRDVGDEYFYVGKYTENEKYIALIYSQAGMWAEKPPVHTYLATYEPKKGKIIDFEKIAGMEYYSDSLRTAKVNADMSVEIKYFTQEWEKNPDEYGYEENKRTGLTEVASKVFRLDANGNISEVRKMLGMKGR